MCRRSFSSGWTCQIRTALDCLDQEPRQAVGAGPEEIFLFRTLASDVTFPNSPGTSSPCSASHIDT